MEKMNQVSVTEFMSKSKEEMYDNAVEMVEKYNRLADICNDSSERISELVIERNYLVEKHNTYTHSLNADIAAKDAKIELMQKELDGRKAGYVALKAQMDVALAKKDEEIENRKKAFNSLQQEMATRYITIETHNGICKNYEDSIDDLKKELEEYKDLKTNNAKRRTEIIELRDKIEELEKQNKYLTEELEKTYAEKEADLKNHNKRDMTLVDELGKKNDEIKKLKEENSRLNARIKCDTEYWKEAFETQSTSLAEVRKLNDELVDTLNKSSDEVEKLEKQVEYLKKELDQTCTCKELDLKGHQFRETALVNTLADKNDKIKSLVEENSYLKSEIKQKQDIIKKAYERYSNEVIKTRKDLMEVAYRDIEKDNGYVGFKLYVKNTLTEAKGDKKEANEVITDTIKTVYAEWSKEEKRKEEAKKELNKAFGVPCGEDSIE